LFGFRFLSFFCFHCSAFVLFRFFVFIVRLSFYFVFILFFSSLFFVCQFSGLSRRWLYLWSRLQHCAESVLFVAAAERAAALHQPHDRAPGLRLICSDYINSENLG
jgi:hypothetical protein